VTYLALWIFELVIDNTSDANFVREFGRTTGCISFSASA
jgi:hypothetical protein